MIHRAGLLVFSLLGASSLLASSLSARAVEGVEPSATMPTPYPVAEDPPTDSDFGPNNELTALRVGFDDETLSLSFDYTLESNAIVFYLDLGLPGGVNDFARSRGYQGAYPTMLTLGVEVDAIIGTYGAGGMNLYRVMDKNSQDITGSAQLYRTSYKDDGSPGTGRVNIPWSVFFPGGETPVPPGLNISVAGIIRANDDDLPAEYIPDNDGQLNTFVVIEVDPDGDGFPNPEPLMDSDGDGFSPYQGDCNDGDPLSFPMAEEICGDGIDQDCAQDGDGEGCITPTPSPPTPSATATPATPTLTATPTATSTSTSTNSATPTPSAQPTPTLTPTLSPTPGDTATPSSSSSATPTSTQGPTPSPTHTSTATADQSPSLTPTASSPTATASPAVTPSEPLVTPSPTSTQGPGDTPLLYLDVDGDGFTQGEGDCDDLDSERYPGAEEQCDDVIDKNCDDVPGGECINNPGIGCDCDQSAQGGPNQLALFLMGALFLWRRPR